MTLNKVDLEANLFNTQTNEISLKTFENVLNQIENDMENWLQKFDWNKETLLKKRESDESPEFLKCPYDPTHTGISKKNYDKHVLKCSLKNQKHQSDDIIEYKKQAIAKSDFQLTLDENVHNQLLATNLNKFDYLNREVNKPLVSLTNNHLYINHTPQERLILYNYSIEQFKNSGYPINSHWNDETFLSYESSLKTDPNTKNKNGKSYNDILTELRDKKRRPKSYKTNKSKSFTEVLRDLIGTQMNLLEELSEFNNKDSSEDLKLKQKDNKIIAEKRSHSTDSNESLIDDDLSVANKSHKKKSHKYKSKKSRKHSS